MSQNKISFDFMVIVSHKKKIRKKKTAKIDVHDYDSEMQKFVSAKNLCI